MQTLGAVPELQTDKTNFYQNNKTHQLFGEMNI